MVNKKRISKILGFVVLAFFASTNLFITHSKEQGIDYNFDVNIQNEFVVEYQESQDPLLLNIPISEEFYIEEEVNEIGLVRKKDNAKLENKIINNSFAKAESVEDIPDGTYEVDGDSIEKKAYQISSSSSLRFYFDDNENGTRDGDEPLLSDDEKNVLGLKFQRVADSIKYDLDIGWNLISIPMFMQGTATSRVDDSTGLILTLNKKGANVTHVGVYRKGKFLIYSERITNSGNVSFGKNFKLIPGEGIFVKNNWPSEVTLRGDKVEGPLEISVQPGWNLVGIFNSTVEKYGGYEMIDQMNKQGINVSILSKWNEGSYENIILQGENRYGNDYKIKFSEGYWLKSDGEEVKNFSPESAEE